MRGFKGVLISIMVFGLAESRAESRSEYSFQSLRLEQDGTFELRVNTPKGPAVFKDRDLQADGQKITKTAGVVSVDLVHYADHPLITAFVSAKGVLNGALFVLKESEKGSFVALNAKPIMGKTVDFEEVVELLKKSKGNDSMAIFSAMVNFFANNSNKDLDLFTYANTFENGVDSVTVANEPIAATGVTKGRGSAPAAGSEDDSVGNRDEAAVSEARNDQPSDDQATEEPAPQPRRERVKIRRPYRDPYQQRQGYPRGGYYGYPQQPTAPGYGGYYGGGDPRQPQGWGW